MRILLPTLHVRRSAQAIALAAGNLKACLPKKLQKQTELLDLYPEQPIEEQGRLILDKQPHLIAFPLYLWNRRQILQLCRVLRKQQPDLFLLAGGPEASADPTKVIAEGSLDGVLCGEGDLAFAQLASELNRGETDPIVSGFLPKKSKAAQPISPAICPDLNQLPSPWLSGTLPLEAGCGVLWEVARGCTFNCAFCYDAKGHQGVRPLPLERLKAELQLFIDAGVTQAWILDSTFNAPAERGKQLLKLLINAAPQIHFHLEAKVDFLDEVTATLLSQLSCSVQIGLQSAKPEVLKPLHRTLNQKKMSRALQQLSDSGITFGLDLIYGLPGDNHQGFRDSLDYALQQRPNQVDIFPLAVLPGTELHQQQAKFGIDTDLQPPYLIRQNRSYSAEEMEQSRQLAVATDIFYNRGRAVGFFLQFCEALSLPPVELLENFSQWLNMQPELNREQKESAESWKPINILLAQQSFMNAMLQSKNKTKLQPLVEDLLNYHFNCAEVLLAEECYPAKQLPEENQLLTQRWQLNPVVSIQRFNFELEELEEIGGEKLNWQLKQLTAEPSYGIFLRQQGQSIIEMLQDDFARILLKADGQQPTEKLVNGIDRQTVTELLQFAASQGLLLPVT